MPRRPWLRFSEALAADSPGALAHGDDADGDEADAAMGPDALQHFAARAREVGGADVGLALRVRPRRGDLAASVVVVTPSGVHRQRRLVYLEGPTGRSRSALAAAAILLEALGKD